jgi:AcrR family transcriptional regulator
VERERTLPLVRNQKQKGMEQDSPRARLLKAGMALFAEKGYADTSVREIVEKAGVTKPVLYYHFENKEGIFRAILDWAAEQQEVMLAEVLETPGTVLDRLIRLHRHIYDGLRENRGVFRMIYNLVFGPPQGAPDYDFEPYHQRMFDTIRAIYLEGMAKGEVKTTDPNEVAFLVLGLIGFCFHLDQGHPESVDSKRPERLLQLAYSGLVQTTPSNHRKQNEHEQI